MIQELRRSVTRSALVLIQVQYCTVRVLCMCNLTDVLSCTELGVQRSAEMPLSLTEKEM